MILYLFQKRQYIFAESGRIRLDLPIGDEAERDGCGQDGELPDGHRRFRGGRVTGVPGRVDDSPRTDRITDVVGAVSERGSASGQDLDERVGVLDLVGVLLCVGIHPFHALTLGRAGDARLSGVDVVVDTVQGADDDHGGNTLEHDEQVVLLVNLTGTHGVLVKRAHGPAKGATLLAHVGVESVLSFLHELLVVTLLTLDFHNGEVLLVDLVDSHVINGSLGRGAVPVQLHVLLLHDSIVGNVGSFRVQRSGTAEEQRALHEVPPLESVVLLDDFGVDKRNEEEGGQNTDSGAGAESDGEDVVSGLLVEAKVGRTLVDDRQGADGAGDEEPERRGVDGPLDRVLADVNDELDEREDDGTEAGGGGGRHAQSREDGRQTFAVVPTPLDLGCTSRGDTDTRDGRDERVGGRDVSGVAGAPHDPGGRGGESASECKHLHTGITIEGSQGDDTVLNRRESALY
nr:hypothetical protein CFP56_31789 [Quercus suber]